MQSGGNGTTAFVQVTYPPPLGGAAQTITIPWGQAIQPSRRLNVLWNSSNSGQVIVMIETDITGD
jgi:hypothetical protein